MAQALSVTNPPEGWTVNPDEMMVDIIWGPDGDGTIALERVGLPAPAQPLMIKDRNYGGDAYVFAANGDKIYLLNMSTNDVFLYVKPAGLKEILDEMRKPAGKGSVERQLLPQVE